MCQWIYAEIHGASPIQIQVMNAFYFRRKTYQGLTCSISSNLPGQLRSIVTSGQAQQRMMHHACARNVFELL